MARTRLLAFILWMGAAAGGFAQMPAGFSWVNLETDTKVMPVVRKSLHDPKITAIREVGVWDGFALVMAVSREADAPTPDYDRWTVYNVSLTTGKNRMVVAGYGVKPLDWIGPEHQELAVTYFTCWECEPTTMFTTLHFVPGTGWRARWTPKPTGPDSAFFPGAPELFADEGDPDDFNEVDQVFAVVPGANESFAVGHWFHSRNRQTGKAEDDVHRYSVDPTTQQERIEKLTGPAAIAWEREICAQDKVMVRLSAGQDSKSCKRVLGGATKQAAAK